ncbi:hypothetical protein HPK19_03220 [Arthrobacter citreus]|nr:hypothetical protein HPK19_03220 [Arthrobacter citreus]
MYIVISSFRDKTDNNKRYHEGDTYECNNSVRIAFLIESGYIVESVIKETVSKPKKRKNKAGE